MKTRNLFPLAASCLVIVCVPACGTEEEPVPQEESAANLADPESESVGEMMSALSTASGRGYDRNRAAWYAQIFAKTPNPKFAYCANRTRTTAADCTNFASQALWYGGLPLVSGASEDAGWWYRGGCGPRGSSKSWRQVNDLLYWLTVETHYGEFKSDPRDLQPGDLIFYKLRKKENGYACDPSFVMNHTTIVTGFDSYGEPLVSYHSNDAENVPWDIHASRPTGLGDACRALLVHIRY